MKKILIIQAVYYQHIADLLLLGTKSKLDELGYEYQVISVDGALEIPLVISFIINSNQLNQYDGFIALGCVIRGETSHYEIVCNESARSISYLSTKFAIPVANGILTVENEDQAIKRADPKQKNKGGFCAKVCVDLINLKKQLS